MRGKRQKPAAGVRPTTAKLREALLNILHGRLGSLEGITVLDAFAGSGQIGWDLFEAGARRVVFIDRQSAVASALRQAWRERGSDESVSVLCGEATAVMRRLEEAFDVIFFDPPYSQDLLGPALAAADAGRLLAVGGVLIAEHHHKDKVPDEVGELRRYRLERYGETALSFFERDVLVAGTKETGV